MTAGLASGSRKGWTGAGASVPLGSNQSLLGKGPAGHAGQGDPGSRQTHRSRPGDLNVGWSRAVSREAMRMGRIRESGPRGVDTPRIHRHPEAGP